MLPTRDGLPEGNRFGALLKPIKDLTADASWGVDIAKELTDYAESLGISLEQSQPDQSLQRDVSVDFATAALLLQGSTSIYSRKIEHLYVLVYSTMSSLNQLHGKRSTNAASQSEAQSTDAEDDGLLQLDEVDFLTLDDDVPTADLKTITLDENARRGITATRDETCLLPVPPMLAHHGTNPTEQLGGVDYKILTAQTHSSGALILPGCPPIKEDLSTLPDGIISANIDAGLPDLEDLDDMNDQNDNHAPLELSLDVPEDLGHDHNEREVDNNREAYRFNVDGENELQTDIHTKEEDGSKVSTANLFLMLDPHEEVSYLVKPVRKGKFSRLPKREMHNASGTWTSTANDFYSAELSEVPFNSSWKTYVSIPRLRDTCLSTTRRRATAKRKRVLMKKFLGAERLGHNIRLVDDEMEDPEMDRAVHDEPDLYEDEQMDGYNIGEASQYNDFNEHPSLEALNDNGESGHINDLDTELGEELRKIAFSYEETCRKHLERSAWMWEQRSNDAELVQRVEKWKAKIQPRLEEEEQRSEFDISQYGQKLLDTFHEETRHTSRAKITKLFADNNRFNICRKFLATLQLANEYKVEIVRPGSKESSDFFLEVPSVQDGNSATAKDKSNETLTVELTQRDGPLRRKSPSGLKRRQPPETTPKSARRRPMRQRILSPHHH